VGAAIHADTMPRLYVQADELTAVRAKFPAFFACHPRIVIHHLV